MRKKLFIILMAGTISLSFNACGSESGNTSTSPDVTKSNSEKLIEEKVVDEEPEETAKTEFAVGETWEVEGQWRVTVNSITPTDERNEFSDKQPAAVYIIEYTYENLGFEDEDGFLDGLFIDFESGQIVDAGKTMGYSYPGDVTSYAEPVPVGAAHTAQSCIGVNTPGNFTVKISSRDSDNNNHAATFICNVE